jgi:large subunit ribosomal protein L13
MIIDGKDQIVGRVATYASKQALLGSKVDIINCEEMVFTGNYKEVVDKFKRKKSMGAPKRGPYQFKRPEFLVRRIIRGMLPYKQYKGKNAYSKIKCYVGSPKLEGDAVEVNANVNKVPNLKFVKVKEICKELGWQK